MRIRVGNRAILAPLLIVFVHFYTTSGAAVPPTRNGKAGAAVTDAKVLFARHCATCHGQDGRAKTFKARFNHARNLTDQRWQTGVSDEHLFNSISRGRGRMPAWGGKLTETEIEALVAYVRQLGR